MKNKRQACYLLFPILGMLFYLCYLNRSAIDLVYSDYIRLINSYLPDVWDPEKFFVPDLLTRIPINYLERAVNVELFGYSVTFDRIMGVLGFGLSAFVIAEYAAKMKISMGWYAVIMILMFSLNKWEMLYNGTGWAHFLAFAFFFYHYLVLDRVVAGKGKRYDMVLLFVLPAVTTIGVAGPYCAIYTMTLVLSYGFVLTRDMLLKDPAEKSCFQKIQILLLLAAAVIPLILYLWSNSQAVYVYSGAVEESIFTAFLRDPKFFLTFFLKSFSSMIFGVELIGRHFNGIPGEILCLLGLLVFAAYFFALFLNFYYRIAEKTIFPLMLLAAGGMNHLMVLVSRWIFMPNDMYGMSSRYALQYQVGILGILLTFALVSRRFRETGEQRGKKITRVLAVVLTAVFLVGNIATTAEEFSFGIHRKNHSVSDVLPVALDFENVSDEELQNALEYRKPGIRDALTILKENHLNIFR